jgi:hypothetical protein
MDSISREMKTILREIKKISREIKKISRVVFRFYPQKQTTLTIKIIQ